MYIQMKRHENCVGWTFLLDASISQYEFEFDGCGKAKYFNLSED
jgi:hypothetical protein